MCPIHTETLFQHSEHTLKRLQLSAERNTQPGNWVWPPLPPPQILPHLHPAIAPAELKQWSCRPRCQPWPGPAYTGLPAEPGQRGRRNAEHGAERAGTPPAEGTAVGAARCLPPANISSALRGSARFLPADLASAAQQERRSRLSPGCTKRPRRRKDERRISPRRRPCSRPSPYLPPPARLALSRLDAPPAERPHGHARPPPFGAGGAAAAPPRRGVRSGRAAQRPLAAAA